MASLSTSDVSTLLAEGVRREYARGAVLLHEGEESTHVMVILSGYAKVTAASVDGDVTLLAIRSRGELVGELAALDGLPRSATVTAAGPVHVQALTKSSFHGFLARRPEVKEAVGRSVTAKLRSAIRNRIEFSGCSVKVRVARVLLRLAAIHGEHANRGTNIACPLSQPELAALVNAAEPTVHKALAELRRQGVLVTGYRSVTILDATSLRAVANVGGA
jgi:CRP-like cAMP-binding protein